VPHQVQYSVEQIIAIVRQHENGRPAKELCRQYGSSEQTLKRWKAKYKGMPVAEAKR
jgi:putative transposase